MTVEQFEKYLSMGHGRAVTQLKKEGDPAPFRKYFLEYLRKNTYLNFRGYYNEIAKILGIDGFEEYDYDLENEDIVAPMPRYMEESENLPCKTADDFCDRVNMDFQDTARQFSSAPREIVIEIAERAINETDLEKKIGLVALFNVGYYNEFETPLFPLSDQYLIDILEMYKWDYGYPSSEHPCANGRLASVTLGALLRLKTEKTKEYCLNIVRDEFMAADMRIHAISILDDNYTPDDYELVRALYYHVDIDARMAVAALLERLSKQGIKEAPYELLFDSYENGTCLERIFAVNGLANMNMLTAEMIEECRFDSMCEIRKTAEKLIK